MLLLSSLTTSVPLLLGGPLPLGWTTRGEMYDDDDDTTDGAVVVGAGKKPSKVYESQDVWYYNRGGKLAQKTTLRFPSSRQRDIFNQTVSSTSKGVNYHGEEPAYARCQTKGTLYYPSKESVEQLHFIREKKDVQFRQEHRNVRSKEELAKRRSLPNPLRASAPPTARRSEKKYSTSAYSIHRRNVVPRRLTFSSSEEKNAFEERLAAGPTRKSASSSATINKWRDEIFFPSSEAAATFAQRHGIFLEGMEHYRRSSTAGSLVDLSADRASGAYSSSPSQSLKTDEETKPVVIKPTCRVQRRHRPTRSKSVREQSWGYVFASLSALENELNFGELSEREDAKSKSSGVGSKRTFVIQKGSI